MIELLGHLVDRGLLRISRIDTLPPHDGTQAHVITLLVADRLGVRESIAQPTTGPRHSRATQA